VQPLELLILSAALQAAGNVLQKQRVATRVPNVALGQVTRRPGAFFGPLLRDPRWLLGNLLVLAGAIAGLQALAVMDLSVLKALGRLETIFVILAGVIFLGERLRPGEVIGVVLLLTGALLLALSSGEASGGAASREAYLVLAAATLVLIVPLAFGRRADGTRPAELALAAAAGVLFATGDILTKGATDVVEAGAAGGRFSVVESASMVGLVGTPEFGLAIAAYVAGSILTQAAFSVGRVSVIGPVMAIGNLLLPIAFGLLVLREDPTGDRLAGIATIALGTALLGRRPHAAVRNVARSIPGVPS
jgi:drug/metabolite transporter (DMT)-like permease